MARARVEDRRVRRTRHRLRDALVSLIHEKSYDAIAVKDIVERADVGRTTFYTHFADKNALLESGIDRVLDEEGARTRGSTGKPFGRMLWFSLPVLEHVDQFRRRARGHLDRRDRAIVHEHLRTVLIDHITADVRASVRPSGQRTMALPTDLLVEYLVTTFVLVLNWWVESDSSLSPRQADDLFVALVVSTLEAQAGR